MRNLNKVFLRSFLSDKDTTGEPRAEQRRQRTSEAHHLHRDRGGACGGQARAGMLHHRGTQQTL